jgi:hypothetical protein
MGYLKIMFKRILSSDVIKMNIDYGYRVIKNPINFLKRLNYKKLDFDRNKIIDKKTGFKIFKKNELLDTNTLVSFLKKWSEKKIKSLDKKEIVSLSKIGSVKPYYINLLEYQDLKSFNSLKSFLGSNEIINLLYEYYGFIPHLSHLALFFSNNIIYPNKSQSILGTQNAHFDNHDLKHVKLFLNISDVNLEDGPLHIFNKTVSDSFRMSSGRILNKKPVRDDKELNQIKNSGVSFVGESGSLAIVDTSNCLHYGSRVNSGKGRLTLVIHFTCFDSYSLNKTKKYQDFNIAPHKDLKNQFWPLGCQ